MPITRRTSARKKVGSNDGENDKENILDKERTTRESKLKALMKIENHDDSCSFFSTHNKPPDTFDLLRSSPMKQEVNFKPLSFWSKKVKDLESKENIKKKKCELYELSETDESNSSQGSNWGKKPKKKAKATLGHQKNKNKLKKVVYDFNTKNLVKKHVSTNRTDNKEGSIIRERIILRRLNAKFTDCEDKFSFKKVTDIGLTSTPGKSEKLNVVGGSTFDFLSPISIPEGIPKSMHEIDSDLEGKLKANLSYIVEMATPKRQKKTRNSRKAVTKDLKGVSGSGHPMGDYSSNYFTELDYFTEEPCLGESIGGDSVADRESIIETLQLNCDVTVLDPSSFGNSQDEMNISFLHVTEDESNEEIGVKIESNKCPKREHIDYIFSDNAKMHVLGMEPVHSPKIMLISADSDTKLTEISSNESFPDSPLPCASPTDTTNETELRSVTNSEVDEEFTLVEDNPTDYTRNNSNTHISSIARLDSFSNVTVRRYFNGFLNFRRSAKEGSFELPHDVNNINQEFLGNSSCVDFVKDETLQNSQFVEKEFNSFGCKVIEICDFDACDSKYGNNTKMGLLPLIPSGSKNQQTDKKPTIDVTNNSSMGSNQYCSKEAPANQVEEHLQIYSDSGNDSSVFISSPETPSTVENNKYSVCKPKIGEEREEEPACSVPPIGTSPESLEEHRIRDVTCYRVRSRPKCYGRDRRQDYGNETRGESLFFSSSAVKTPLVEHSMSDVTLSDEFDFPLPIFESTTCVTPPVRKRSENTKPDVDEITRLEKVVEKKSNILVNVGEQDISNITSCRLKPGKKWARSAIILKKSLNGTLLLDQTASMRKKGKMYQTFVEEVLNMQNDLRDQTLFGSSRSLLSMTMITNKLSDLSLTVRGTIGNRTVKILKDVSEDEEMDSSFRCIYRVSNCEKSDSTVIDSIANQDAWDLTASEKNLMSARSHVLMRCNQEAPLPFEEYFNEKTLKNCRKIGEGTFGEVFMCNSNRVIKVMPIEGPDEVNGERQKKFDEILSEMVIAMELSNLRNTDKCRTSGFCELKQCWCVEGKYPSYLIDLWNDFDSIGRGSENDSPVMFKDDQLYIILEFGNGGKDLEAFVFTSGEQSLSILFQVAFSLAAAENLLEFEHRDLHWGNILIAPTREKYFRVTLNEEVFKIPTKGVKVTIIDFTLSRITYGGCCIYNDLAIDPTLFTSEGDYQFEIYRMMKREVMNDWSLFKPKTNIFWLHYVADKMLKLVRYKRPETKIHKMSLAKLDEIKTKILQFSDSEDFVLNCDLSYMVIRDDDASKTAHLHIFSSRK